MPRGPSDAGQWKAGQSGNPAGRQTASRNRLNDKFITELANDFEKDGVAAIVRVREDNPVAYLQICARFQPQEVNGEIGITDDLAEALRSDPRELGRRIAQILSRVDDLGPESFPPTEGNA